MALIDNRSKITELIQRINNLPEAGSSSAPNLEVAYVTPSAESQVISPEANVDGFSAVFVHGDEQLIPENVKSGVEIFGVTGSYTGSGGGAPDMEVAIITPSAEDQTVMPSEGKDGFYYAFVHGDADLIPSNIKSGVEIFGVTGSYTGSGGTGSSPYSKAELLTWIPASDTATMEVAHSLGVVPDGYRLIRKGDQLDIVSNVSYVLTLDVDIAMKYSEAYYPAYGTAIQGKGLDQVVHIGIEFSDLATNQYVKAALTNWTFKGGETYEILVYKR